ncbi:hypothetical protein TREMEDRAFT_63853 [Tremella mesenterica DSM 1558]|uniref:uncharacterized protein n=1 Tax=Tremella mesenterica (strain ATCC 24925 / CBS 8224 / DSM 1558 / NBRC 9311 / NRRL Y-6157 / RJB 2259-6 / UBC 559-6) TaxID=578456 RepID=UPI0003F48E61|nr:uncharacterized protein TREMEDRAFT_63853 [Tremella mesenterica DSM 1558]EIW67969.1 hypothetical protein TREMEDRAFT_63853 [Tremella mesenterica DSM 1558]
MSDIDVDIDPELKPRDYSPSLSSGGGSTYLPSPKTTPQKVKSTKRPTSDDNKRGIKRSAPTSEEKGSPVKKRGAPTKEDRGGVTGRKMGAWTKAEVRQLWDALGLTPPKVKWDEVADKVPGRDKLSCSNKWRYDMFPKLEAFINSLGD